MEGVRTFHEWVSLFSEHTQLFKEHVFIMKNHYFVNGEDGLSFYLKCRICRFKSQDCECIKQKKHLS